MVAVPGYPTHRACLEAGLEWTEKRPGFMAKDHDFSCIQGPAK